VCIDEILSDADEMRLPKVDSVGLVSELSNLFMQRFDLIKQSLWDGDNSTIFFNTSMSVPKKYEYIPIEHPKVNEALN